MNISQLLDADRVRLDVPARSKKHALEIASDAIASAYSNVTGASVFDALNRRERLGCTGLGQGLALPHARLGAIDHPAAALIRLTEAVPYDADDDAPVQLILALVVPRDNVDESMYSLRETATLFASPGLRERLFAARKPAEVERVIRAACASPVAQRKASG